MSDYLKSIKQVEDIISYVESRLDLLSESLYTVGNTQLGDNLYDYKCMLSGALDELKIAVRADLREQMETSQQSSINILNACLAMSTLNKEEG